MVRNVWTTSRVSGENGRCAGISGRFCCSSRDQAVEAFVGRQLQVARADAGPGEDLVERLRRGGRCAGGCRASAGAGRRPRPGGSDRGAARRPRPSAPAGAGRRRSACQVGEQLLAARCRRRAGRSRVLGGQCSSSRPEVVERALQSAAMKRHLARYGSCATRPRRSAAARRRAPAIRCSFAAASRTASAWLSRRPSSVDAVEVVLQHRLPAAGGPPRR